MSTRSSRRPPPPRRRLAGIATALVHTKLKINNIIAGIIVMTALYTVNLRVMGRANISLLKRIVGLRAHRRWLNAAGLPALGITLRDNATTTIAITFVLLLVVSAGLAWFMRTDLGSAVRATGENETMIRSLGVNTDATKVIGSRSRTRRSRSPARWWRRTTASPTSAWASASSSPAPRRC
jgi:putative ABC transport system permease protein